jgi:hypothetical protein
MLKRHGFSVRVQGTRREGRDDLGKAPLLPKKGLATIQNFGEYRDCHIIDIPRLAGTPARLLGGFCVSRLRFSVQ